MNVSWFTVKLTLPAQTCNKTAVYFSIELVERDMTLAVFWVERVLGRVGKGEANISLCLFQERG